MKNLRRRGAVDSRNADSLIETQHLRTGRPTAKDAIAE